ncbi:hypothetical protein WA538_002284 [Blastocystis sp. DL]
MSAVAIRMPSLFSRVGVPMLHSSCVLGCTLFAGDLLGQAVSSKTDHMSFWWLRVICSDMKRSLFVGVSGFLFSGPLSFFVHRMVFKLYPGNGRLTVMKRIVMTTSVSPLIIACGIIPSTFLYSRDLDAVHVSCFGMGLLGRRRW